VPLFYAHQPASAAPTNVPGLRDTAACGGPCCWLDWVPSIYFFFFFFVFFFFFLYQGTMAWPFRWFCYSLVEHVSTVPALSNGVTLIFTLTPHMHGRKFLDGQSCHTDLKTFPIDGIPGGCGWPLQLCLSIGLTHAPAMSEWRPVLAADATKISSRDLSAQQTTCAVSALAERCRSRRRIPTWRG